MSDENFPPLHREVHAPPGHVRLRHHSHPLRVSISSGPTLDGEHLAVLTVRTPEEIPGLLEGLVRVTMLLIETHDPEALIKAREELGPSMVSAGSSKRDT